MKPTGERRQSPAMSRPMVAGRGGSGALVSDTGTSAIAIRMAISANSSKPAGSYVVSRNCPAISTQRLMKVYADMTAPRLAVVARSFSQLSITT